MNDITEKSVKEYLEKNNCIYKEKTNNDFDKNVPFKKYAEFTCSGNFNKSDLVVGLDSIFNIKIETRDYKIKENAKLKTFNISGKNSILTFESVGEWENIV